MKAKEALTEVWKIAYEALDELEELKKSDASKEQSSIYYFNEFKRVERELEELKEMKSKIKQLLHSNVIGLTILQYEEMLSEIVGEKDE